jgi:hypothetical protein
MPDYKWYEDDDGKVTNQGFIDLPKDPFKGDAPLSFWKSQEGRFNNKLFTSLMRDTPNYAGIGAFIGTDYVYAMYLGDEPVISLK